MREFKDVLCELRTQRGLSQRDLAEKLHRSTGTIGMWENGTRMPSREAQEQIADFFNVTLDYLSGRDSKSIYYLDPETARLAEELRTNSQYRAFLDAGRKLKPDEMKAIMQLMKTMTGDDSDDNTGC